MKIKNEYFRNAIQNKIFIRSSFFYVLYLFGWINRYLLGKIQMESIYNKYQRKLKLEIDLSESNEEESKIKIWFLWYQKIENAPQIVKDCFIRVKKLYDEKFEIIELNNDNLDSYITFPKQIYELRKKGKLSDAAYSDLIRLYLLKHYGGIWMDATCWLAAEIPEHILYSDFFVFKSGYNNQEVPNFQSWFIISKKNNPIINNTYNNLIKYTCKYQGFPHYFFMFFIFQMMTEKFEVIWKNVPYYSDLNSYVMQFDLNGNEPVEKISFIQKLSYKKKK